MSIINLFNTAGSALTAQAQRMNVAASNMANADSVSGPNGEPYRAKQVRFELEAGAVDGVVGRKTALLGPLHQPQPLHDPALPI